MLLKHISIQNVRNIVDFSSKIESSFNWFVGENGAGKTSVLEALALLLTSKSFRSRSVKEYIRQQHKEVFVTGIVAHELIHSEQESDRFIAFKRSINGATEFRDRGKSVSVGDFLSEVPPVQVLAPDAENVINASPHYRRKFIDWGVFHVKHSYLEDWRAFNRILKQRNAALKGNPPDRRLMHAIDCQFIPAAIRVAEARKSYWEGFKQFINQQNAFGELSQILDMGSENAADQLSIPYYQGWSEKQSLEDVIQGGLLTDLRLKTTQNGPQRADFDVKIDGISADKRLSRGQIKTVFYWLKVLQALHLRMTSGKKTLFLLDDVASELDKKRRIWVYDMILKSCLQVFGTGIELDPILVETVSRQNGEVKVFHVKHGVLYEEA